MTNTAGFVASKKDVDLYLTRASYYRWCASHSEVLPGNDPITGIPRKERRPFYRAQEEESRVAYKAMARLNLERAKACNAAK